jgi:hypothetical protein
MLALFLDHPPLFVAGEMALGLSLALFIRASIAAVTDRATVVPQSREAPVYRPSGDRFIARRRPPPTG